jgi:hypothetical protein
MATASLQHPIMSLDESQRKTVAEWIRAGLKLSEIQNRIASEFKVSLTYMDVRFLVDDLKLVPKDVEPAKPAASASAAPAPSAPAGLPGKVAVSVDSLTRPGALASGKVTFSDGKKADWYLDQSGRLGLSPEVAGYRPPASDVQQFQAALEAEFSKLGF